MLVGEGLAWLAYLKRYPPPFPFTFVFTGPLVGFDEAPKRPAHGERKGGGTNKQTSTQPISRGGWVGGYVTLHSYERGGALSCLPPKMCRHDERTSRLEGLLYEGSSCDRKTAVFFFSTTEVQLAHDTGAELWRAWSFQVLNRCF